MDERPVSRRNFLKKSGQAALAFAGMKVLRPLGPLSFGDGEEYRIVEGLQRKELEPLVGLLERFESKPAGSLLGPDGNIDVSSLGMPRHSGINYEIYGSNGVDGKLSLSIASNSRGYLLNKEGFFITSNHVLQDVERARENGDYSNMLLFYDPEHGFAFPARALALSEKYDIVIGKVDIESDFPVERARISYTDSPVLERVYYTSYGNTDYISGIGDEFLAEEIIGNGLISIDSASESPSLSYSQKRLVPKRLGKDLGLTVHNGARIVRNPGLSEAGILDGMHIMEGDAVPGLSGSPVFDLHHTYMGSLIMMAKGEVENQEGVTKKCGLGIYTGARKVRDMIRKYVDAVR